MSRIPSSTKGRTRKQMLLQASFRLFVKKGIGDVSLEDILVESGIKKGNFYHYFTSKDQLVIESLMECYHKPFYTWFEKLINKKMKAREAIEYYFCNSALHMEQIWRDIVKDSDLQARDVFQMTREATRKFKDIAREYQLYDERVHTWIIGLLKKEQAAGRIAGSADIDSLCDFIFSCCEGVYYRWIMNTNVDFKSAMLNVFNFIWQVVLLPAE